MIGGGREETQMARERRTAVYPGSFDPVTRGHLDLIERGAELFDRLVVAVLVNPEKDPLLTEEERVALIASETSGDRRIEVRSFRGLVVDLAEDVGAGWILRGIRSGDDLAGEVPMALSNRLCGRRRVETVFLPSRPELSFVSSRLVREIARGGGNLKPFVTPRVEKLLKKHQNDMFF